MTQKTAFCEPCGRRHRLGHPHLAETAPAQTVAGAATPDELAEQARQEIARAKPREKRGPSKVEKEQDALRRVRLENLGRKVAVIPFTGAAYVTSDGRWRSLLAEQDIAELGQAWADAASAFGLEMTGKIASLFALTLTYAEVGSRVYATIRTADAESHHGDSGNEGLR